MSGEGGQNCPPNPEKEKIYKPNPCEGAQPRPRPELAETARRAIPLVFIAETQRAQIDAWQGWLVRSRLPPLDSLDLRATKFGRSGFNVPGGYWPPEDGSPKALDWIAFLGRRLAQKPLEAGMQSALRRAS